MDENNMAADNAEADTVNNAGTYVHKFKVPFEYEGQKYATLTFYFGKLTGKDSIAAEAELNAEGKYVPAQEVSVDSLCKIAARAANIFSDAIEAMPLKEFRKIVSETRSFLLEAE